MKPMRTITRTKKKTAEQAQPAGKTDGLERVLEMIFRVGAGFVLFYKLLEDTEGTLKMLLVAGIVMLTLRYILRLRKRKREAANGSAD